MTSAPIFSVVHMRYAGALVDLAEEAKAVPKIQKDLEDIQAMIASSDDFASVIASPLVSQQKQEGLVSEIAKKAKLQKLTTNFLGVLVQNRRLSALPGVIAAFNKIVSERSGEVAVLAGCGVHFLDAPAEMIPAALAYIGEDPDSQDKDVIAKAEDVLTPVAPFVQKFHSSEYINALANGDICVAFGWSGDILQARDRAAEAENGVEIEYYAPSEGALMWFDNMAIPVDAPNPDAAHKFLNFIMDAQNMAAASNYVYYANGNLASQEFLEEDVIGDTAIYPDAATLENLYTTSPYGPKTQRLVTRMWTKIKSGT